MRIGRLSEPRFVFVCQLIEVIREADANETSGELGLALPSNLVGESQLSHNRLDYRPVCRMARTELSWVRRPNIKQRAGACLSLFME